MHIVVSDNETLVAEMRQKLRETGGYCPCSTERNADTLCFCKVFREQESGLCHCGLYRKMPDGDGESR